MKKTWAEKGESAFPLPAVYTPEGMNAHRQEYGMSLRDYFAGQALQGLLCMGYGKADGPDGIKYGAETAYKFADAMIAERVK